MVGNFRADIAGAAVYGWIAGEHAASNLHTTSLEEADKNGWCLERMEYYNSFMNRQNGAHWKEANLALQQITSDYAAAGPHRVRSESLLKAGLKYLSDLRKNSEAQLGADCSHNLLRIVECLDLMDNAEIIMHAALERKETRGMHIRSDFTFTNTLLNEKFLTIRKDQQDNVITEWRKRWNH